MRLAPPAAADLSPFHPLGGRAAASFFFAGIRLFHAPAAPRSIERQLRETKTEMRLSNLEEKVFG
jgi:hypothetical protein